MNIMFGQLLATHSLEFPSSQSHCESCVLQWCLAKQEEAATNPHLRSILTPRSSSNDPWKSKQGVCSYMSWFITHRIHGAAICGDIYHQYTPVMIAYIPAPWILWDCYLKQQKWLSNGRVPPVPLALLAKLLRTRVSRRGRCFFKKPWGTRNYQDPTISQIPRWSGYFCDCTWV